jgi:hypothetical protein
LREKEATQKANEIRPPLAGQICVLPVNTSANSVSLQTCVGPQSGQSAANDANLPPTGGYNPGGGLSRYIYVQSESANVGLVFGPNANSVTGNNAPNLSNTGQAGTNGCCWRVYSAQPAQRFYVTYDTVYVGYVGSGSGNLIISVGSRA